MRLFTDQTGRTINLHKTPHRIVSLVPSQTELLHYLGLEEEVVGITKFCVHPNKWFQSKKRIGGTKNVYFEKVLALKPDLVLANKEENVKEQVEAIAQHVPTWVSDVNDLPGALQMITAIGDLTGKQHLANKLLVEIQHSFAQINLPSEPITAAYLIWKDPYMTIGGDTYINDMLLRGGFKNIVAERKRYPVISLEELQALQPQVLLLSSEPYPFSEKHVALLHPFFPAIPILLVDGEIFSWYGSRLLQAPPYMVALRNRIDQLQSVI